jgi:probable H4MPT-linked C1 transfer pathway protein
MAWLGLDIGGANLKAADGRGWACSVPFAIWRDPGGLAGALVALVSNAPNAGRVAVTMTGELCDCFRTKAEGVRHILATVDEAASGRDVRVYLVDGRLVSLEEACGVPHLAAASNWHALARFACRYVNGTSGVLVDIGSTTTDIVPLADGMPRPQGLDDTARLVAGELVYTGVGRTPLCAVVRQLPWRGQQCPVAAELFATTADAYVLLGLVPEQPDTAWTADGRPLTMEFARERLARMICADVDQFNEQDAQRAAAAVRDGQLAQLCASLTRVVSTMDPAPGRFVLSGAGEFVGREVVENVAAEAAIISLAEMLGNDVSACAAAHALAVLAREADES